MAIGRHAFVRTSLRRSWDGTGHSCMATMAAVTLDGCMNGRQAVE